MYNDFGQMIIQAEAAVSVLPEEIFNEDFA